MIADVALVLVAIYLAIGVECCYRGPMARKRVKAAFGIGMMAAVARKKARRVQLFAFRALLFLGIVFLWPVFLIDDRREMKAVRRRIEEHQRLHPYLGQTFQRMSGAGVLSCRDCKYSQKIESSSHGIGWYSYGFQCRTCGKFDTRTKRLTKSSFPEPNADIYNVRGPLEDLPPKYRPYAIQHLRGRMSHLKAHMNAVPRERWMGSWEGELAAFQEKLSRVPAEELERIKAIEAPAIVAQKAADAEYEASLVCECGGPLDREAILFCPGCRSKNLSYDMTYIT